MSIRTRTYLLLLALASTTFSFPAISDPIQDYNFQSYEAGWFPNFYQTNGPMNCPRSCYIWSDGRAMAEQEKTADVTGQFGVTHVCKISNNEKAIVYGKDDPSAHWLYGNQFDDEPACFAATPDEVKKSDAFMCLCVIACREADLIVSKIHDPEWDHTNNRSVIEVTISNIGNLAAGASFARLTDTGNGTWAVLATPALAAGASVTLTFYFNGYWVFDPNAELKAEADYKNDVKECDESNNTLEYFKMG